MGHSEGTRLAYEDGARAAISMPDRPGLRRRARRRTSGPAYRRAGGFHDRTRLTDEDRTRVAMKRRRQCRAATRRQVFRSGFRRGAALINAVAAGARDDFLTFSLYHLKIASNFQVSIPTSIRRKKTASTRPVDAVLCAASARAVFADRPRREVAPRRRTQRGPAAQRCASAVSTSVCSSGTIRAARASSYAYGRVSSM